MENPLFCIVVLRLRKVCVTFWLLSSGEKKSKSKIFDMGYRTHTHLKHYQEEFFLTPASI